MTRDILLNSICPMSRVYDCCIADGDYDCDNCKRLTKEWFDEHDKQIRADAIDEFVKRLKAECRKHYVDCDPYFGGIVDSILYEDDIDEIAELLKAGGKNEQRRIS